MSYDELKELCREAWKEKHNYLSINRLGLEDKIGSRNKIFKNLIQITRTLIHKRILFKVALYVLMLGRCNAFILQ